MADLHAVLSDEQMISRILKGHTDDFRKLIYRHQEAVFRLAYHILQSREDAEDAVQQTFLLAYQNLSKHRKKGKFRAWIRRIATNVCLKMLSPEIPCDDLESLGESAQSAEVEALNRVEFGEIRKVIGGLPDLYRAVIVLRYGEEMKCSEIAELLGENLNTVKVRLHRAEKMLAERLMVVMKNEV